MANVEIIRFEPAGARDWLASLSSRGDLDCLAGSILRFVVTVDTAPELTGAALDKSAIPGAKRQAGIFASGWQAIELNGKVKVSDQSFDHPVLLVVFENKIAWSGEIRLNNFVTTVATPQNAPALFCRSGSV